MGKNIGLNVYNDGDRLFIAGVKTPYHVVDKRGNVYCTGDPIEITDFINKMVKKKTFKLGK